MPFLTRPNSTRRQLAIAARHVCMLAIALGLAWQRNGPPADKAFWAIVTYFIEIAVVGFVEVVVGIWRQVKRGKRRAHPSRTVYRPTKLEGAAYGISLVLAFFFPFYDAFHNAGPDTHPLQRDRLILRLIGIFFIVANLAIFTAIALRIGRPMVRLRKGLCPTCGYDLRATTDRCPECGSTVPARIVP